MTKKEYKEYIEKRDFCDKLLLKLIGIEYIIKEKKAEERFSILYNEADNFGMFFNQKKRFIDKNFSKEFEIFHSEFLSYANKINNDLNSLLETLKILISKIKEVLNNLIINPNF